MAIQTKLVEYKDGGTVLEGLLAWDDSKSGPRPGVMVSHAWGGREAYEEGRAKLLAEMGYAGFALDLYGKGVRGSNPEENQKLMAPFVQDRPMLQNRLKIALSAFQAEDVVDGSKVAAIGYCFGGLCVIDMARSGADIKGAASFHGILGAPGNTDGNKISAKVLAMHGWDDPMAPPEAVLAFAEEMSKGEANWQLHAYGNTVHAFTTPGANMKANGVAYDADADRRSWYVATDFLKECIG